MNTDIQVLLIEDSFSDAQMVKAIISSSNLGTTKLHHAERFKIALRMLAEKPYDLILLDLHLPDGEGLGLITQLKQQVPEIPVVVLTGCKSEATAAAALQKGAQDYVLKSDTFSPAKLAQLGHTDVGNCLVRKIRYAIKRAELTKQRETDKARYDLANIGTDDGIWDWDLKANCIYLSARWKSLIGVCEGVISNKLDEWFSRIHLEDQDRFQQTLEDYLAHQNQQFYCEYRIKHTDGHYLWVLAKGKALWDENGVAYRIVGSQTDITDRKQQEHAAYQKRELAQTVLHTVGAGLLSMHAMLHISEGRYEEAEPCLKGTLSIQRSLLDGHHPDIAVSLYNLASLYDNQFRFREAETLFQESLALFEKALGSEHPHTQSVKAKVEIICRLNQAIARHNE